MLKLFSSMLEGVGKMGGRNCRLVSRTLCSVICRTVCKGDGFINKSLDSFDLIFDLPSHQ